MLRTRRLTPADTRPALRFLRAHPEASLTLRSYLRSAGLVPDQGERHQGTWVGAFLDGALAGVVCLCWNGHLLLEAPMGLPQLAVAAAVHSPRSVTGLIGRWSQVEAARDALGLREIRARFDSRERLYNLELDALRVPAPLVSGELCVRDPREDELEILIQWRIGYSAEALAIPTTPRVREQIARSVRRDFPETEHAVLVEPAEDRPLAYAAIPVSVPDCVQIGGVWTPPELRGRGYGRAVVAGALLRARERGVAGSVLFTDHENVPAQRAYEALGFEERGDYGVVLFPEVG